MSPRVSAGPRRRGWFTPALLGLAVVVVAIAATLANVALLGSVGGERLGQLRPVAAALAVGDAGAATSPTDPGVGDRVITGIAPSVFDGDKDGDGSGGAARAGSGQDD